MPSPQQTNELVQAHMSAALACVESARHALARGDLAAADMAVANAIIEARIARREREKYRP
jgi:hypothetical protein